MDEAYTMTRMLSNRGLPVNCIDRDSSTFEKGVTVTTFYMAKGLEFDQVFGVFPKKRKSDDRAGKIHLCNKSTA